MGLAPQHWPHYCFKSTCFKNFSCQQQNVQATIWHCRIGHFTWGVLIFASSRGLAKKFSNFLRTLHCGHGQPFRALHGNCCRDLSDWKWNSGSLEESGCPTDHLLPIHFRAGPIQSWLWPLQQRQADNDLFGTTIWMEPKLGSFLHQDKRFIKELLKYKCEKAATKVFRILSSYFLSLLGWSAWHLFSTPR